MATQYLTDRMVRTLEAGAGREEVWDTVVPGLGLRYSGRKKAWFFVYHSPGSRDSQGRRKRRRITLGEYPAIPLAEARSQAAELREKVKRGIDPALEHQPVAADGLLFRDLAARFMQLEVKTLRQKRRYDYILRTVLPAFGDRLVVSLRRSEIVELLSRVSARGKAVPHEMMMGLHRILQVGMQLYDLPGNPAHGITLEALVPRTRVLSAVEVRKLWQACLESPTTVTSMLLRLRLLTGQRGAQLRHMNVSQLERDALGLWWNVPSEITKSGKPNRLFLSPLAEDLLAAAEPFPDGWIFGRKPPRNYKTGGKGAILRLRKAVGEVEDWRGMDLRRTAATWMAQRGVPRFIVKRVLGHADRDITAVYDLYSYDREVKAAVLILEQAIREAIGEAPPAVPIVEPVTFPHSGPSPFFPQFPGLPR